MAWGRILGRCSRAILALAQSYDGAASKVTFPLCPLHCKISTMDEIPNPNQADNIARAYLKQLRKQGRVTGEKVHKPGLQAWRELEDRLMLDPLPNEPKNTNEVKMTTTQTSTINKAKKAQSIWNRPVSKLWRKEGV
jgi:hypothetical protein